jgi:ABC-type antimicrobial peptide transport system permease subunit
MSAIVGESSQSRRWTAGLLASFAALALALALVGIYGVVSWAVAQRTREIGIRMALGAGRAQVLSMVLAEGACLALRPVLAGLVFGVSTADPGVYLGAGVLLLTAALLACYLPALRASRVAPLVALRHD